MPFALLEHEPIGEGLQRVLGEELRGALAGLDPAGGEVDDDAVHDVRRRVKRVRALLRLLRQGLSKEDRRRSGEQARDAARELAGLRDARVLLDALDGLVEGPDAMLSADGVQSLRDVLRARHSVAWAEALEEQVAVRAAGLLISVADARPAVEVDAKVLGKGLKRAAKRAAAAFEDAREDPTAERLHTWRKRTKDLRHQLETLVPLWPSILEPVAAALHEVSDLLGGHHDLSVLREVIADHGDVLATPAARSAVEDVVAHRLEVLRDDALALGARIHAEHPGALADRIVAYAATWPAGW